MRISIEPDPGLTTIPVHVPKTTQLHTLFVGGTPGLFTIYGAKRFKSLRKIHNKNYKKGKKKFRVLFYL